MIRHALDTLSSKTPTLVLITLSAVVFSPRCLPAALRCLLDYEDFIIAVNLNRSTQISRTFRNWLNRSLLADASADRANFVAEILKVLSRGSSRNLFLIIGVLALKF
jgi:hypothetical protein